MKSWQSEIRMLIIIITHTHTLRIAIVIKTSNERAWYEYIYIYTHIIKALSLNTFFIQFFISPNNIPGHIFYII